MRNPGATAAFHPVVTLRESIRRSWLPPLVLAAFLAVSVEATAEQFAVPAAGSDVVGELRRDEARAKDTLLDLARRHGLGYEEITNANPGVDPWLPGAGTPVVVPKRRILPMAPREGIVINLPEHRLYWYPPVGPGETPVVWSFPVSIGKMDWNTPLGVTRIVSKVKDPTWTPPQSVREIKRLVSGLGDAALHEQLAAERAAFVRNAALPEMTQRLLAFLEKKR